MTNIDLLMARRRLGLSQTEMGKLLGVSREVISEMERAVQPVDLRTELAVRYRLIEGIFLMDLS